MTGRMNLMVPGLLRAVDVQAGVLAVEDTAGKGSTGPHSQHQSGAGRAQGSCPTSCNLSLACPEVHLPHTIKLLFARLADPSLAGTAVSMMLAFL